MFTKPIDYMEMRIDIHQHLWPTELVSLLAARRSPPLLRRAFDEWHIVAPGEREGRASPSYWDVDRRSELVTQDGIDLALVALSSPLGIETLPAAEAEPLLEAYHDGVAALPSCFGAWAAPGLDAPDPDGLAARLDQGFVGASIPAAALADPEGIERYGSLLECLERRDAPLFVHPGPAPSSTPTATPGAVPNWWPALTRYVAQMNDAWHAFAAFGRRAHPSLRVVFGMLAGLAPLHAERLSARGGAPLSADPDVFLDTSSYGPRAIDAVARELGIDGLVYGSDRPVVGPRDCALGPAAREAMLVENPARLLAAAAVAA